MNIAKLNEERALLKPDWIKVVYENREIPNREMVR